MKSENPGLSFLVPAYNEEKGIGGTLERLVATLEGLSMPFEVIVVNDGSTDRTAQIATAIPKVRVISHPINVGYGNAIKNGIQNARYDWIGMVDSDGTYPVEDIPKLVAEMQKGFQMVIAKRENISAHDRPTKRLFRALYKTGIRLLTGNAIEDPNSGFRIFEKQVALEFFEFLCGAFSFTTSLTILATEKPFFITFVPIQYQERQGKSKVRHLRDAMRTLQLIIQGVTYYNPLKFFLIMAFAMIFLVGFPAMCIAMFRAYTLSSYFMIFGCTVALLIGLGILGDIIRVSMTKRKYQGHAQHNGE